MHVFASIAETHITHGPWIQGFVVGKFVKIVGRYGPESNLLVHFAHFVLTFTLSFRPVSIFLGWLLRSLAEIK